MFTACFSDELNLSNWHKLMPKDSVTFDSESTRISEPFDEDAETN